MESTAATCVAAMLKVGRAVLLGVVAAGDVDEVVTIAVGGVTSTSGEGGATAMAEGD